MQWHGRIGAYLSHRSEQSVRCISGEPGWKMADKELYTLAFSPDREKLIVGQVNGVVNTISY